MIEIRGFKRSHGGNVGHYIHPLGGSSPPHHSYRVNYGIKRENKKWFYDYLRGKNALSRVLKINGLMLQFATDELKND